jgi:hypothetical protein
MKTAIVLSCIVDRLAGVRGTCPDLRFGQLIATIGLLAEDETGHSLWDVEDIDFMVALERFAEDLALRRADPSDS